METEDMAVLDHEALGELAEVMEEDLGGLLLEFLADLPERLARLRTAIEQDDALALERSAHRLKSGCLGVGAARLAALGQRLEEAGHDATLGPAGPLLEAAEAAAEATALALREHIPPME